MDDELVAMCVTGAPVDEDGVCTEHGETACVVHRKRRPSETRRSMSESSEGRPEEED
ncbi:MAG TPA: hypothetical protein VNT92_05445 [Acidimicrobiia bacterium]|nr:hypothetical protein [Acidimicrobiia bacterium]